jgi:thiol-disulfide isomerase/thioredoxin
MGSPFPDIELPGADGSVVSLASSLAGGRPALFIFVSPTCGPCRALLPEIAQWQIELKDKINFVLLTVGKLEENKEKLLGAPEIPIAIQKDREIAEQVRAKWTPTAILVRSDGKIASRLAAGDGAIHELIAKIRNENVGSENLFLLNGSNGITPPMIGAQIPSFKLAEIDGKEITDSNLIGSPTLAVFWSPTCPHCSEFAVELKEWELSGQSGGTNLIVFTNVDHGLDDLDGLNSPVVFDRDYAVSTKFGMFGTPSAVLVDESGIIATETAVGSPNIWALLGRYSGS